MRQTFKIKFYCRPAKVRKNGMAPVECSVIVNGERQMITLPKSCKPAEFPTTDIKMYCTAVENKLNQIYTNLVVNNEPITAYIIKDIYLNGGTTSYTLDKLFADGLALKTGAHPVTYNKYRRISQRFTDMIGNGSKEANTITSTDILKFKQLMIDEGHKPQTLTKDLTCLKYYFNLAFNAGKIKHNPFAGIKVERVTPEQDYLTYEEICQIRDAKLNERLDKTRNMFLFMCFSGLEYTDLVHLEKTDVKKNNKGQWYIKKKRIKTGVEYLTILFEDAAELWELFDGDIPVESNQKANAYLKEIAKIAKIDKNITTLTARHSFATFCLSERMMPVDIVQRCLGHISSRQTLHYAKMLDETVFNVAAASTRLGKAGRKKTTANPKISRSKKCTK